MSSGRIVALLLGRHPTDRQEWAVFRELATATANAGRTIDLFALNCWRSGGFRAVAYEVKVSRGDFMRELADPSKRSPAEALAAECYFATPPSLVKVDEVPEGWGLIECGDGGCKVRKAATQRRIEAWPIAFCAALARRCTDEKLPLPTGVWKYEGRDITAEQLVAEFGLAAEDIKRRLRSEVEREVRRDLAANHATEFEVFKVVQKAIGWPTTPERAAAALASSGKVIGPAEAKVLRRTYEHLGAQLRDHGVFFEDDVVDADKLL